MNNPSYEDISLRAYHLWEERGRPEDQQSSVDCWLQAEHDLSDKAPQGDAEHEDAHDQPEHHPRKSAKGKRREVQGGANDGAELDHDGTPITNLERSMTPDERRSARSARHGHTDSDGYQEGAKVEHFLVLVNLKHLRIYDNAVRGNPELVESVNPASGQQGYSDNDTDQAGRFGRQNGKGRQAGASIDERLPMLEEQQRRVAREAASHISRFLNQHPGANWSYAAGPTLHKLVLDALHKDILSRMDQDIRKDLVNMPLPEMVSHFAQKA